MSVFFNASPAAFLQLLEASGAVLACSGLLLLVFFGLGLLLQAAWHPHVRRTSELDTTVWLGWGVALCGLQLWHLFRPTGLGFALVACSGGFAGLVLYRRELRRIAKWAWHEHRGFIVLALLLALWLSNLSVAPPRNGDSGLYHFSSVRWAAAYRDVPGLANLQGRLGFTSSYFLYVASLEIGLWFGRSFHLANGVLFLLPLARGLWSLRKVLRREDWWNARVLFDLALLFPVLEKLWGEQYLTSPSPDLPVFLLGIAISSNLIGLFDGSDRPAAERQHKALAVASLCALGLTIKPSLAAFAVSAAVVALLAQARAQRHQATPVEIRPWAVLALTWVFLVVPSLARSVIVSGYPAYPVPKLGLAVDWRVPADLATDDYNWVRSWARRPLTPWREVLASRSWLGGWAHNIVSNRYTVLTVCLPVLLAALSFAVLVTARVTRRIPSKGTLSPVLALLPSAISLCYWFFTAPAPRFAGSSFWVLGCGSVVIVVVRLGPPKALRVPRAIVLLLAALASLLFAYKCWQKGVLVIGPGPDAGFHPVPRAELKSFQTHSGLKLNVPATGEWCWDAPLPCTPYPNPLLRLRKVDDLAAGFTLAGPKPAAPRDKQSTVDTQ